MSYETGLSMEERVTSLFQPDTLLPDQYLETFRRKFHLEPEKKLMLAVLEDAIACYQKYIFAQDGKGKIMAQETEQWLLDDNSDWLFSFDNVCETLGFDPAYMREGMMRWKEQKLADRSQARVYRLAARRARNRRNVRLARRSTQRVRRAAGR